MDAELKKKWLDALRSGEYKQTTANALRVKTEDSDCFCALGVLCDIYDPTSWEDSLGSYTWREDIYLGKHGLDINLTIADQNSIMNMNDTQRLPFDVIADFIEENL